MYLPASTVHSCGMLCAQSTRLTSINTISVHTTSAMPLIILERPDLSVERVREFTESASAVGIS
ncbi:hypothetical protein D9M71_417090 [compost metagenome]